MLQNRHPDFNYREGVVNGKEVILVTPKSGVYDQWTSDNLDWRSILIDKETNQVLSRGFHKFFNYIEREDLCELPDDVSKWVLTDKIDGSCLIISYINGEINMRTRGCLDGKVQYPHSRKELEAFEQQYPKLFQYAKENPVSILCEWTTPMNQIVINYGPVPELRLIGIVHNQVETVLYEQDVLDKLASDWNIKRPHTYNIASKEELQYLLSVKNIEGYVVYFLNGNHWTMKKLKTQEYLERHSMRSSFTHNSLLNYWLNHTDQTVDSAKNLYQLMQKDYEFEILEANKYLFKAWDKICKIVYDMQTEALLFYNDNTASNRKEFALKLNNYEGFKYPNKTRGLLFAALKAKVNPNELSFMDFSIKLLIKDTFEANKNLFFEAE